jgi:hypothetical protein
MAYLSDVMKMQGASRPMGMAAIAPDIEAVLRRHFKFVGGIAFARSDREGETAKQEVARLLRAEGFNSASKPKMRSHGKQPR